MKTNRFLTHALTTWLTSSLVGAVVVRAEEANRSRRNVEIEFEEIEGSIGYEVKVVRKDQRGKELVFKLKKPRWSANIKPGPYVMQLRAYDDRGVPGAWSPPQDLLVKIAAIRALGPTPGQVLNARSEDEESVDFRWEASPQAKSYKVEVRGDQFEQTFTAKDAHLRTKLPVARAYSFKVVAVDEHGQDGEREEKPTDFQIRGPSLRTPRPQAPLSRFVDRVEWAKIDHAERYETTLRVWNPSRRSWDEVTGAPARVETAGYDLDISRPSGKYKLSVTATAPNRASSKRADLVFDVAGGFDDRSRMHDAQLRDSLYKPSKFYAIASLLPVSSNYHSVYNETNSRVTYASTGVVARVGAGYMRRDSSWGGFMIADVSRIDIANAGFTGQSAEAHATYSLNLGHRGRLLVGAGGFLKQLPLVIGSPFYGFSSLGRVSMMGPHVGASYELPFNQRWSVRADARAYYSAFGSTGGGSLTGTLSHQVQVLGAYRYGQHWTLLGGLGQRHDEAAWAAQPGPQSFAKPGATDRISVDGTYVNLSLEFSF